MAMYVYKDKERNEKLYANNASKEDKGIRFYCPNPKCDAHMYICSVDGFRLHILKQNINNINT